MSDIPVQLAVEDLLSEFVIRTLLARSVRSYRVGVVYNKGGFGYLKRTAPGWNSAAKGIPFLLLTDLDQHECPASLKAEWLTQPQSPNLIFRVAVREVEAWILADTSNFASFLGISPTKIPLDPESLLDAKGTLVALAARSRISSIRLRLSPKNGSTAKQGPDYNSCLGEFLRTHWNHKEAGKRAPSLRRCIDVLDNFTPSWSVND